MGWTATDNFDSYTATNDLNGLNGGDGWTAAWVLVAGTITVETAPAGGQSGNAAYSNGGDDRYSRTITGISNGIVSFRIRTSIASTSDLMGLVLYEGTQFQMAVGFVAGNIAILNGPEPSDTWDTIQSYSIDAWYRIDVEFDNAKSPKQYRARVDGGSWSPWKNVVPAAGYAIINNVFIWSTPAEAGDYYLDDINIGPRVIQGAHLRPRVFRPGLAR